MPRNTVATSFFIQNGWLGKWKILEKCRWLQSQELQASPKGQIVATALCTSPPTSCQRNVWVEWVGAGRNGPRSLAPSVGAYQGGWEGHGKARAKCKRTIGWWTIRHPEFAFALE